MKLSRLLLFLTLAASGLAACNNDDDDVYIPPAAYTDHVSIAANAWDPFEDEAGVIGYLTEFSVPDLTENIHENGAVLVYLDFGGGIFDALPQVYNDISILYNTYPGSLEIRMVGINNIEIDPPAGEILCKIVLIEGVALKANPSLDPRKMTLSEVEKAFDVKPLKGNIR